MSVSKSSPGESISIVSFAPAHAAAFRELNVAWITRLFQLEPMDLETLDDPQRAILARGGAILIAEEAGVAIGCVALIPHGADGTLELAKMAVVENRQGRGVGRLLMARAIALARSRGAPKVYLESNTRLQAALRLYESVGFRRIPGSPAAHSPYARVDIAMELDLLAGAGER